MYVQKIIFINERRSKNRNTARLRENRFDSYVVSQCLVQRVGSFAKNKRTINTHTNVYLIKC